MELKEPVRDLNVSANTTIKELIDQLSNVGGFQAQELYRGVKILEEMFNDENAIKILSFPACIISTGIRGVIKEAVKRKMFDLIITTTGTLDHDIARSVAEYHLGYFEADDVYLADQGIHRLGNVFIKKENYGEAVEEFMRPLLKEIYDEGKRVISTYELVWEIGKRLGEDSISYWAWKNKIPVIIPGITDGAVGTQVFIFKTEHPDFDVSVWKDEEYLSSLMFGDKVLGALMIGGGISKHHTIWWAQFGSGLKYAVYITSAVELDGSLSGARTREAISWGKVKKEAKHVTVWGDATTLLPLMLGYFF